MRDSLNNTTRGLALRLLIGGAFAFVPFAPALAADMVVPSKIDAVSIYADGATVSRTLDFDVPAGETTLVARDFPLTLDPNSIRLEGKGDASVSIGAVDAKTVYADPPPPDQALEKLIQDTSDKRDAVSADAAALTAKKGFIERLTRSIDFSPSHGDDSKSLDAPGLRAIWNAVGDDLATVNEAIRQDQLKIRDIDAELAKLTAQRDGRPQGSQRMEVRIALSAATPSKGHLSVSYQIGGASWQPVYDARLDTTKGSLDIIRRASISQSTGEDWTDAALTVSTAHATSGAAVPKLGTTIVAFLQPPIALADMPMDAMTKTRAATIGGLAAAPAAIPEPAQEVAPAKPIVEAEAALDTAGFQSSWALPGRTTILSGPTQRSIRLASFSLTPTLVARTAPALQETAYLEATFDHGEDTPLFPGRVSIYRDGLYAGQTDMPLATRGEPVRLGFGATDTIRITRDVTRKLESQRGVAHPTKSDRRDFKISLHNAGRIPMTVSVEEALPVSEDANIKVDLTTATPPATEKDADDRRGIMVWTLTLQPGEDKDIRFGYRVSWPADRDVNLTQAQ